MDTKRVIDRRRHPRLAVELDVQLQEIDSSSGREAPTSLCGISRDVSESGMRVWVSRAYPVSSTLLLTFECPELGWSKITSRVGFVVWTEPLQSAGQYLMGVRFGDQEDTAEAA